MKRYVLFAAVIGFFIPMFWGMLALIFIHMGGPFWTTIYSFLVYLTCPAWLIPGGTDLAMIATPFANAAIYAIVSYLIVKFRTRRAA